PARGPQRARAVVVLVGAPGSMKPSMSRLVTRPATPEPCSEAMFTPCSAAIFRTSGEDFVRTRSSNELPFPACDAAMPGAGGRCRTGVAGAVTSRWGAGGAGEIDFVPLFALAAGAGVGAAALGAGGGSALLM